MICCKYIKNNKLITNYMHNKLLLFCIKKNDYYLKLVYN